MPQRPNILFLMSDEHRADLAGFAGNDIIRTPFLDSLAETGTVFDNCYTPSPICIPARQAMMAGEHCKKIGVLHYGDDLPPFSLTFAKRFAQYAYHSVACGKLHHMGPDQMQGWSQRIAPDAEIGWKYIDAAREEELARYAPEEGIGKWTNQKEVERARIARGKYQNFDQNVEDETIRFIKHYFCGSHYDRPQGHRPLLLKVSLLQPHYPFFAEEDKFNYYLNRVPLYREERSDHPVLSTTQCGPPVEASSRDIRRATAAYYAMVEKVDDHLSAVAGALEEVGQNLDDWIIVYTSDHGDMLGQHGVWEKTQFYEGSARVPLIIRWPENFAGGRRIKENVNTVDLYATLCELAGIPAPEGLDSRSLVPLLGKTGGDTAGASEAFWDNETISHMRDDQLMIKRDSLKYLSFGPDVPEVLFDLEWDPGETENLAASPDYADRLSEFRKRRNQLGYL